MEPNTVLEQSQISMFEPDERLFFGVGCGNYDKVFKLIEKGGKNNAHYTIT